MGSPDTTPHQQQIIPPQDSVPFHLAERANTMQKELDREIERFRQLIDNVGVELASVSPESNASEMAKVISTLANVYMTINDYSSSEPRGTWNLEVISKFVPDANEKFQQVVAKLKSLAPECVRVGLLATDKAMEGKAIELMGILSSNLYYLTLPKEHSFVDFLPDADVAQLRQAQDRLNETIGAHKTLMRNESNVSGREKIPSPLDYLWSEFKQQMAKPSTMSFDEMAAGFVQKLKDQINNSKA